MSHDADTKWSSALTAYEIALERYTAISDATCRRILDGVASTESDLTVEDNARTELQFLRLIAWRGFRNRM